MGGTSIAARRKLLAWYRRSGRDLPWRRTSDPYAIWVSEIMLQQTRVAAVIPYFERFLRRFPDVETLARARADTVLAHWAGLGYYRRARNLHAAAKIAARDGIPATEAGWRALAGVGSYTAAAIASIAFGEATAVVDGNVERVLSRMHRIGHDPARVRALAREWLAPRAPGDFNQAVMELGATVCVPRAPRCAGCPVRVHCAGRDEPESYPAPRAQRKPVTERRAVALIVRRGSVQLVRRSGTSLLDGMWELPPSRARGEPIAVARHAILDRRLLIEVHRGKPRRTGRWFTPRQLRAIPLTTATRKVLLSVPGTPGEVRKSLR